MKTWRTLLINAAVIAAVVLLAFGALGLSRILPAREIVPNAGTLEEAGFTFNAQPPAE